jgi:hypothetical protein
MLTIPFDAETLKKIITGEIEHPVVDYNNSKIKGKNFITYFSNLKYKSISINFTDVSVEEKQTLVAEYIKHQSMVKIEQLESTVIKCLFKKRGYDLSLVDQSEYDQEILSNAILSNEEIEQFVQDNGNLVDELCQILDGTILYAIKNLNAYKEVYGESITDNIEVDKLNVGKTFVSLFANETFNCHYYSTLPDFTRLKYFEHYYDRPIYSGQTLMSHITGNCVIFPLIKMIVDVEFTPDQLNEIYRETDAALI